MTYSELGGSLAQLISNDEASICAAITEGNRAQAEYLFMLTNARLNGDEGDNIIRQFNRCRTHLIKQINMTESVLKMSREVKTAIDKSNGGVTSDERVTTVNLEKYLTLAVRWLSLNDEKETYAVDVDKEIVEAAGIRKKVIDNRYAPIVDKMPGGAANAIKRPEEDASWMSDDD